MLEGIRQTPPTPRPPAGPPSPPPGASPDRVTISQHETAGEMLHALGPVLRTPANQTYAATINFIHDHPFFHEGLMDAPIGFGKHFRNVPFIGPGRIVFGLVTLSGDTIKKGIETTRGTWDAA